jgi:hypothetical protein
MAAPNPLLAPVTNAVIGFALTNIASLWLHPDAIDPAARRPGGLPREGAPEARYHLSGQHQHDRGK